MDDKQVAGSIGVLTGFRSSKPYRQNEVLIYDLLSSTEWNRNRLARSGLGLLQSGRELTTKMGEQP